METPAEQPLRELTAQEFIEILEGSKRGVTGYEGFYRNRFQGIYQIWEEEVIVFHTVQVNEDIIIPKSFSATQFPIIITGKSYFKKVIIYGGTFKRGFSILDGNFDDSFEIVDANFPGYFQIMGGNFIKNFSIFNGKFSGGFSIAAESQFNNFSILGATVENFFSIFGGTFHDNFHIAGGIFSAKISVGGIFEKFTISGGNFSNEFRLVGRNEIKIFEIINGKFTGDILIESGKIFNHFSIKGGQFKNLIINSKSPLLYINIFEVNARPGSISFLHITSKNFTSKNSVINTLRLQNIVLQETEVIQVNDFKFNQFEFINVLNYGNITLTDVNTAPAYQLNGDGKLEEKLDSPTPKLTIQNSDLGKTTLIGCDFSEAEFCLESSKITEMFVTGTKFPEKLSNTDSEQRRVGYGQLKKVYENRGDGVEANRYLAREMWSYLIMLISDSNSLPKVRFRRLQNLPEAFNLLLNFLSNRFGHSWFQAFFTTLAVSGLFYWGYCHALGYRYDPKGYPEFRHLMSYFLEFINPLHDADYIAKELTEPKIHPGLKPALGRARIVEGLSRIFIAYFIYQLIQAFRKHGKKGD